jgi:hypothetical protein
MPWAGPPAIRLTAEAGGFEPFRLRKKIPQGLINGPYSNHNRFTRFKKVLARTIIRAVCPCTDQSLESSPTWTLGSPKA